MNKALLSFTLFALSAAGTAFAAKWQTLPEYDSTYENSQVSYRVNLDAGASNFGTAKFTDGSRITTLTFPWAATFTPPLADGQKAMILVDEFSCSGQPGKSGFSKTLQQENYYTGGKVNKWFYHAPKWKKANANMNDLAQKVCRMREAERKQ
ncbi:hypothetical protein ACOR62_07450 [Neisseria lisongii]|uniref:Uncharacterized protein n=1 Tax=Neisseria lisongii TaxID=2912188 RepID=A0AAW5AM09_9NEIS|nr:hypothetical protein [Neisseria lisongii]MCF7530209.1 hypothetical protein [Neisseria lisongii]